MMRTWAGSMAVAVAVAQLTGVAAQMQHGSALPQWAPTWQMNRSTFLECCNNSGPFNVEVRTPPSSQLPDRELLLLLLLTCSRSTVRGEVGHRRLRLVQLGQRQAAGVRGQDVRGLDRDRADDDAGKFVHTGQNGEGR